MAASDDFMASWKAALARLPKHLDLRAGHTPKHRQRTLGRAVHVVCAQLVSSRGPTYFVDAGVYLPELRESLGEVVRPKPQMFECHVCWRVELLADEAPRLFAPGDEVEVARFVAAAFARFAPITAAGALTDPALLARPLRKPTSDSGPFPLDARLAWARGDHAAARALLATEAARVGVSPDELASSMALSPFSSPT